MKKIVVLLSIFFMISCGNQEPPAEFEGREKVQFDDLDNFGDLCPGEKFPKWGHNLILVDTTVPLNTARVDWIKREVFDISEFEAMPPYDLVSIYHISGINQEASQNRAIFKKCRPLTGTDTTKYELDKGDYVHNLPTNLAGMWKTRFTVDLQKQMEIFTGQTGGDYSLLLETLKEASQMKDFDFGENYKYRNLIIVSDMVQNSIGSGGISLQNKCRAKWPSWEKFKNNKSTRNLINYLIPDFGDTSSLSVTIYYLSGNCDAGLNSGVQEFWNGYFSDAGIENVKWIPETIQAPIEEQ